MPEESASENPSGTPRSLHVAARDRFGTIHLVTLEEMARRAEVRKRVADSVTPPSPAQTDLAKTSGRDSTTSESRRKRTVRSDSWTAIRKHLRTWDQPQMLGLIQDLCEAMPEVRVALGARLAARDASRDGNTGSSKVELLEKKIRSAIRVRGGSGAPRLGEAKQIIARYGRLSVDADGSIRLHAALLLGLIGLEAETGRLSEREIDAACDAGTAIERLIPEADDLPLLRRLAEQCKTELRRAWIASWIDDLLIALITAIEAKLTEQGGPRRRRSIR